jgi:predicted nucleic acid-binding protein
MVNATPHFATSEDLFGLLSLFEKYSIPGGEFLKVDLIVDANIILEDIQWMIRKAKSKEAKTALLEVLEAGTVTCFAPQFLQSEIDKHIPLFAERYKFDEDEARGVWSRFKARLKFVETGDPPKTAHLQDPKDWPYLRLQEIVGATILSRDTDIPAMGGRVSAITLTATLRGYARESAVVLQLRFFGYVAVAIPTVLILEAGKLVTQLVAKNVPRPPNWVRGASIGFVVALLVYPPSRSWLKSRIAELGKVVGPTIETVMELVQPLISEYERAQAEANKNFEAVKSETGV